MSDEAAIRALLQRLTHAWDEGDATAFADTFTEDADYITFFGAHTRGRSVIEAAHRPLFEGPLKGSRLTEDSGSAARADVRFLHDDVALVIATGGSTLAGSDAPDPSRDSIMTLTAVREAGDWRFASFQNTRRIDLPGAGGRPPVATETGAGR